MGWDEHPLSKKLDFTHKSSVIDATAEHLNKISCSEKWFTYGECFDRVITNRDKTKKIKINYSTDNLWDELYKFILKEERLIKIDIVVEEG